MLFVYYQSSDDEEKVLAKKKLKAEEGITQFIAHVPVPSQKEVSLCIILQKVLFFIIE